MGTMLVPTSLILYTLLRLIHVMCHAKDNRIKYSRIGIRG